MSKFRAKLCKFEYAGSNSSIFVGGMRPFMYMGGGGGGQTNIGRGSGSIQWFVYGGGVCKGIKVVINTI